MIKILSVDPPLFLSLQKLFPVVLQKATIPIIAALSVVYSKVEGKPSIGRLFFPSSCFRISEFALTPPPITTCLI